MREKRKVLLRNTRLARLQHRKSNPASRAGATLVAQTLKKKAFAHQPKMKKYLRKAAGVLFFAAISTARATPRLLTLFEE
jgi:hypothetical protein